MLTRIIIATIAVHAGSTAIAGEVTFTTPSDDRWQYPFNSSPGSRPTGSCFGAVGSAGFNNRDGVVIIAWDTSAAIPPGQGWQAYDITSIRVTLTNQANASIQPSWPVDLSVDEWFTYDLNGDGLLNGDGIERGQPGDTDRESSDLDPGRPIELFGAGFGPTYTAASWVESSPYVGTANGPDMPRDPFPFVYQDGTLAALHTEDSVSGLHNAGAGVFEFTPTPWAIGQPIGYTPGGQSSPFDVEFEIDLAASSGEVRRHFQEQLDSGRVFVMVTSLRETAIQGSSAEFPSFYFKEGVALDPGAKAASLTVTLADSTVPAVSTWGVLCMMLLVLTAGTIAVRDGAAGNRSGLFESN